VWGSASWYWGDSHTVRLQGVFGQVKVFMDGSQQAMAGTSASRNFDAPAKILAGRPSGDFTRVDSATYTHGAS
jgi:hypothetical protein